MNSVSSESTGIASSQFHHLDAGMQRYVDQGYLAGIVTIVSRNGQIVHTGCYGHLDIATLDPMKPDTIFRIFSMTKPITSLAVLMLAEESHFQLDTPIEEFMPAFKTVQVLTKQMEAGSGLTATERPITILDLLTHSAGLGYGLDSSLPVDALYVQNEMLRMDESLADKIKRIARMPLHHQPGLRFTYSIAMDVLGHLVELVSGLTLDVFFRQRIFEPLGMVGTGFSVPPEKLKRLATLYTPDPSGNLVDIVSVPSDARPQFLRDAWVDKAAQPLFLSGGGGLVSTAIDYLRFAQMLANHGELEGTRLVKGKTIELMTAPHLNPEQFAIPGCSSGLGLTVLTDPERAKMPGSAGAYGGGGAATTEFWIDPAEALVAILMTQYVAATPSPVTAEYRTLAIQAISD